MSGDDDIYRMIGKIRRIGGLGTTAAPAVAERFAELQQEQIARGAGPDGEPWPLTLDGRVPLQTARVTVKAIGSTVVATLRGDSVRHHLGVARGRIRRRVIPVGSIPGQAAAAIKEVIAQHFAEIARGRG